VHSFYPFILAFLRAGLKRDSTPTWRHTEELVHLSGFCFDGRNWVWARPFETL